VSSFAEAAIRPAYPRQEREPGSGRRAASRDRVRRP